MHLFYLPFLLNPVEIMLFVLGKVSNSGNLLSQLWPPAFLFLLPSMQVQWARVAVQYQHGQVLLHHQGCQGGRVPAVSTTLPGLLPQATPHQGGPRGCETAWTPRATLFSLGLVAVGSEGSPSWLIWNFALSTSDRCNLVTLRTGKFVSLAVIP